ncbi:META domain-containing protein [Fretibacter rubidus]|uniref:META domain-containing protein n=1 Tax=Fretibacter rubidus TaxID=570162 RepID=UPI00352A431F
MLRPIPLLLATLALTACMKVSKNIKAASPLPSLVGSEWAPEQSGDVEQFVGFKSGGEIIGHGGCNRFFGTYEQTGDTLTIGPLASTKMACPHLGAESAFLGALQDARSVEATHLKLLLKNEAGETLLTLRRRDWD